MQVNLSLIPVMFGLVLCSATELTFNMVGFLAAVLTNCIDCVQNVFSKKLLNTGGLTPVELQFYTSLAAAALQIPLMLYSGIGTKLLGPAEGGVAEDEQLVTRRHWYLFIDAVLFHFQSVTAYFTMSLLGTVSQSVANTVKRSLLIFATILYFGNPITYLNVAGIVMVSIGDPPARGESQRQLTAWLARSGVFVYNHMRINFPPPPMYNKGRRDLSQMAAKVPGLKGLIVETSPRDGDVEMDRVPDSEREEIL